MSKRKFKKTLIQGRYKPRNPQKYRGDPNNIIYRSSWELKFLSYLDRNDSVVEYASEEFHIPYFDPVQGKKRRYFPDFWVKFRDSKGNEKITVIEIKPDKETKYPQPAKRETAKSKRRFLTEMATFGTNSAKWQAAEAFCKSQGWEWRIMTEYDLGIKERKG